ncbi:MAG TPA: HNH endonuclease [Bryobacteraceae bacterium]|nr:HNH endonuclease [Bryobacteraceae bacterium]
MKFEIDFVESYDRESLIRELQRIAAALGKNALSHGDINRYGRVCAKVVAKRFGSLRLALEESGLEPCRYTIATDQELCSMLVDVWTQTLKKYGRSPRFQDLAAFGCSVNPRTFSNRFGSWNKALLAAANFMPATVAAEPAPPTPSQRRKVLSLRKRFFVFKRDRYRCCMCKRSGLELHVDHKVPVAQGGTDALDNLQTLCVDCNRGKWSSSE